MGMLVNIKLIYVLFLPVVLIIYFKYSTQSIKTKMKLFFSAIFMFSIIISISLLYNYYRFGCIFESGYMEKHPSGAIHGFITPVYIGLYGLLLSSGKSIFLYSPVLLMVFFAYKKIRNVNSIAFDFAAVLIIFHIVLFSGWIYWGGGINVWGPRFLIPSTFPLLICISSAYPLFSIKQKIIFWDLAVIGVIFNISALIFDYRMFTNSTDWYSELQLQFIPHLSPIVQAVSPLINGRHSELISNIYFCPVVLLFPIALVYSLTQMIISSD